MTSEQKKWLDDHRGEGYRVLGTAPGGYQWVKRGILHADGQFDPQLGRARPNVRVGSFEVAVLEQIGAPTIMRGLGG